MPGRGRGGRKGGASRPPQSREVRISKMLSFLLRHGAEEAGIEMDDGGWANLQDILSSKKCSDLDPKVSFEEIQEVVATNSKQRFTLMHNPYPEPPRPTSPNTSYTPSKTSPNDPSRFLIRASQGHSLSIVQSEKLLTPILDTDIDCPNVVVHGTYPSKWPQIQESGGLKAMSRKHMHFARGLPPRLPPLNGETKPEKATDDEEVFSGMRADASVLVWVDVKGSMKAGIKWWRSANNVILTEGVEGRLPLEWVVLAERRGVGEVIFGDKAKYLRMKEAQSSARQQGVNDEDIVPGIGALSVDGEVKDGERGEKMVLANRLEKAKIKESWDE